MTSLVDLDQGGIARRWIREWMGPSIGYVLVPAEAGCLFPIVAVGPYTIDRSITLVTINVPVLGTGDVTVQLPQAGNPPVPAVALPGDYAQRPVTVVDIGGSGGAIFILPAPGENIMGLSQLQLSTPYGGYTLMPIPEKLSWSVISP